MRERLMHLVSSFWLPLPFLTRREVDRDDQKAELCFLVALHTLENACLIVISRWAYCSYPHGQFLLHFVVAINILAVFLSILNFKTLKVRGSVLLLICLVVFNAPATFVIKVFVQDFDQGLFVIDLCLVILNVFAILMSFIYQSRIKLYAGLPQNLPHMPTFGPQVNSVHNIRITI